MKLKVWRSKSKLFWKVALPLLIVVVWVGRHWLVSEKSPGLSPLEPPVPRDARSTSDLRAIDVEALKTSVDSLKDQRIDALERIQHLEEARTARKDTDGSTLLPTFKDLQVRRPADQGTPLNPKAQLATFTKPVAVANTKIWVHNPEECRWISAQLISSGSWESNIQEALMRAIPPSRDVLFVDIGANLGTFSIVMAAAGYSVEAFEPMEYNIELFVKSIHENHFQDHIKLYKVAVGKEFVPKVCLEAHYSSPSMLNLGNNRLSDTAEDRGNNCVPLVRLDSLVSRCPDLVKVDVEGFEKNALIGMGVTEEGNCRPKAVVLEFNGNGEPLIPHLQTLGYRCNKIDRSDYMCVKE